MNGDSGVGMREKSGQITLLKHGFCSASIVPGNVHRCAGGSCAGMQWRPPLKAMLLRDPGENGSDMVDLPHFFQGQVPYTQ